MLPTDASEDQANCPPDYYRRNNGMLVEKPKQDPIGSDSNAIDAQTLATLHSMDNNALVSLITRIGGAMWGIGLMNETQTAEAMLLRLAIDGLTSKDARIARDNINAWLDRKQGKPLQSIKQDTTVSFDLKANSALLNRFAAKLGTKEPIVIDNTTDSSVAP